MEIVVAELRRSRSQVRPCPRPRDRPAAAADTRCARSEHAEDIFKYPMDSKDRWPHKLRSSPLPAEMVRTQQSRSLSVAGLLTPRGAAFCSQRNLCGQQAVVMGCSLAAQANAWRSRSAPHKVRPNLPDKSIVSAVAQANRGSENGSNGSGTTAREDISMNPTLMQQGAQAGTGAGLANGALRPAAAQGGNAAGQQVFPAGVAGAPGPGTAAANAANAAQAPLANGAMAAGQSASGSATAAVSQAAAGAGAPARAPAPAPAPVLPPAAPVLREATALWEFKPQGQGQKYMQRGDVVRVVSTDHKEWWMVQTADGQGWVPASYLKLSEPAVPSLAPAGDGGPAKKRRLDEQQTQQMQAQAQQQQMAAQQQQAAAQAQAQALGQPQFTEDVATVQVPEGAPPGTQLSVVFPCGQRGLVTVPEGVGPGHILKARLKIQVQAPVQQQQAVQAQQQAAQAQQAQAQQQAQQQAVAQQAAQQQAAQQQQAAAQQQAQVQQQAQQAQAQQAQQPQAQQPQQPQQTQPQPQPQQTQPQPRQPGDSTGDQTPPTSIPSSPSSGEDSGDAKSPLESARPQALGPGAPAVVA